MGEGSLIAVVMAYVLFALGIWVIISILRGKQKGKSGWILSAAIVPLFSAGIFGTCILIDQGAFESCSIFGFLIFLISVCYAFFAVAMQRAACTADGVGEVEDVQTFTDEYGDQTVTLMVSYQVDGNNYTEGCIYVKQKISYSIGDKVFIKYNPSNPKTVKVIGKCDE